MEKDTAYRLRLPSQLLKEAHEKADSEDLALAQVMRRFLSAWIAGEIDLPTKKSQPKAMKGGKYKT